MIYPIVIKCIAINYIFHQLLFKQNDYVYEARDFYKEGQDTISSICLQCSLQIKLTSNMALPQLQGELLSQQCIESVVSSLQRSMHQKHQCFLVTDSLFQFQFSCLYHKVCVCVGGNGGRFLMSHHNLDVFLSLCACPGTQGLCLLWETILKFGNEYHQLQRDKLFHLIFMVKIKMK